MPQSTRWKQRPPGSNWGDFGPEDQCGRLNLLTPERVRRAAAEITEGRVFCLSLPLDKPGGNLLNPRRFPPVLRPTLRNGRANFNYRMAQDNPNATDVLSDDAVILEWVSSGESKEGPFRYGGTSVIEYGEGGITAFRAYFDPAQVLPPVKTQA